MSCARGLATVWEVIDNVLVLTGALRSITLLKGVQGRLQDFNGFRLGGLCRLRLFNSWAICLASGAVAAYRPKLGTRPAESVYQAHGVTFQELTFVLFIVSQRAGGVFSAASSSASGAGSRRGSAERQRLLFWSPTGFVTAQPASPGPGANRLITVGQLKAAHLWPFSGRRTFAIASRLGQQ